VAAPRGTEASTASTAARGAARGRAAGRGVGRIRGKRMRRESRRDRPPGRVDPRPGVRQAAACAPRPRWLTDPQRDRGSARRPPGWCARAPPRLPGFAPGPEQLLGVVVEPPAPRLTRPFTDPWHDPTAGPSPAVVSSRDTDVSRARACVSARDPPAGRTYRRPTLSPRPDPTGDRHTPPGRGARSIHQPRRRCRSDSALTLRRAARTESHTSHVTRAQSRAGRDNRWPTERVPRQPAMSFLGREPRSRTATCGIELFVAARHYVSG